MGRVRKRAAKRKVPDPIEVIDIGHSSSEDDDDRDGDYNPSTTTACRKITQKLVAYKNQVWEEKRVLDAKKRRLDDEKNAMANSSAGKATVFVGKLISLLNDFKKKLPKAVATKIDLIAEDDLWLLARNFFDQQAEFAANGIPSNVTIGYHNTTEKNLDTISWQGLLSKPEREEKNVKSAKYTGSAFGEGIYTADDPENLGRYGDRGLIVARLAGNSVNHSKCKGHYSHGNQSIKCDGRSWLVLQKASQCLVLAQFKSALDNKIAATKNQSSGTKSRQKARLCDLPGELLKLFEP